MRSGLYSNFLSSLIQTVVLLSICIFISLVIADVGKVNRRTASLPRHLKMQVHYAVSKMVAELQILKLHHRIIGLELRYVLRNTTQLIVSSMLKIYELPGEEVLALKLQLTQQLERLRSGLRNVTELCDLLVANLLATNQSVALAPHLMTRKVPWTLASGVVALERTVVTTRDALANYTLLQEVAFSRRMHVMKEATVEEIGHMLSTSHGVISPRIQSATFSWISVQIATINTTDALHALIDAI